MDLRINKTDVSCTHKGAAIMNFADKRHFTNSPAFVAAHAAAFPDSTPDVWGNQLLRIMVGYTVANILADFRTHEYVTDRDLNNDVPKHWREHAMDVAVRLGYATRVTWHGKPALRRGEKYDRALLAA